MKAIALMLLVATTATFGFSVHKTEQMTNAGLVQYVTVRDGSKTCVLDYNVTTETVLFSMCF